MECIVLAGGQGTRLRSLVNDLPKCMAPVSGHPFLYFIFKFLEQYNFTHIILSLGYKNEIITEWINQTDWPFIFSYAIENEPLGTGGGLKLALGYANEEQVLVMNGDTFFEINIPKLYEDHVTTKADITIALKPMMNFDRYGDVRLDMQNRIITFNEKYYCLKGLINGGVYLINRKTDMMDKFTGKFSFETEIFQKQVSERNIYGYINDGYFIDIGIPEDFMKANHHL